MAAAVNERVGPAWGFQRAMVGVGHLTPKPSVRAQGGLEVAKWDGCSWFGLGPAVVAKKNVKDWSLAGVPRIWAVGTSWNGVSPG